MNNNNNKSVRMNILITQELKEKLLEVSDKKGISMNEIVNKALAAYLKRW